MKKLLISLLALTLVFITINAQDSGVTSALKQKYQSAQYRTECGGWYLLSYNENGMNLYGFADKEGNVIVSNAVNYKIHPGFIEMEVLDMLKKEQHDRWILDCQTYEKNYNKYRAVEQQYKNELEVYQAKVKAAEEEARSLYKAEYDRVYAQAYKMAELRMKQQQAQMAGSGWLGVVGSVIGAINVPLEAKNAADKVDYKLFYNSVMANRGLTSKPVKPYNPMPTKPVEPSTGLEWKSFSLLQPCPYSDFKFSDLTELDSRTIAKRDGKYGIINASMQEVVPCKYDRIVQYEKGLFKVRQGKRVGLINDNNTVIIPIQYDDIKREGSSYICLKNDKKGVLSKDGKLILPFDFDDIIINNNHVCCIKDKLQGIYNLNYSELYPCQFQAYSIQSVLGKNMLINKKDGQWGVMDYDTGQEVLSNSFDSIKSIQSASYKTGYFQVSKGNHIGLFSLNGKMVMSCDFDKIEMVSNNFIATIGNLKGLYDENGLELIPSKYTDFEPVREVSMMYMINSMGKVGIRFIGLDKENIPCQYDRLEYISDLNAFVARKGSYFGIVNMNGEELFDFIQLPSSSTIKLSGAGSRYLYYLNSKQKYNAVDFSGKIIAKNQKNLTNLNKKVTSYKKKNDIDTPYEKAIVFFSGAKKQTELLCEHSAAERGKFSYFAKHYVERIINEWQQKGEFERMDKWMKRVNENTRQQMVYSLTKEAQEEFIQIKRMKLPVDDMDIVGDYDPEHETYQLKSLYSIKPITIKVPLSDAQDFKKDFSSMKKVPSFSIKNDDIVLSGYSITSRNGKIYKYSDNEVLTHSIAQVNYNFNPLDFGNLSQGYSTSSMLLGTSDVDQTIPETGIVQNKTFAIIIANEQYYNEKNVQFAYNDGSIFKEYCIKTLGLPSSNIHFVPNATLNQMRQQFNWIKKAADEFKGDANFIVYYAGHGYPDDENKEAYLLPIDGDATDNNSACKLSELYKTLGEIPAKEVLVFLDACFSGAQRNGETLLSARGVVLKPRIEAPKGNMVVFSAVTDKQTAFPYQEKVHGLFTYYLLKKLQTHQGHLNMGELYDYVREEVARHSIVINKKEQHPTVLPSPEMTGVWRDIKLF